MESKNTKYWNDKQYIIGQTRRTKWFTENGPCNMCGSDKLLVGHHVNPADKEYEVSKIWTYCDKIREKELAKCIVLCKSCHNKFHLVKNTHGTPYRYKLGCRCDNCVNANGAYRRKLYHQNKQKGYDAMQ